MDVVGRMEELGGGEGCLYSHGCLEGQLVGLKSLRSVEGGENVK